MKLEYTAWFSPTIHPVRNGLYIVKYGKHYNCWFMCYWKDDAWYAAESILFGPEDLIGASKIAADRYYWRGLTHEFH